METPPPAFSLQTYDLLGKQVNYAPACSFPSDRFLESLKVESKFQRCIPTESEHYLIARKTMNPDDADTALVGWKRNEESGDAKGDRAWR
jgi:hypothetical protein